MKSENIIIFFPSIEKGGADKNLFMLSNFLSSKLDNVSILTSVLQNIELNSRILNI